MDITGAWNYGDNASLWVGPDPANGSIARSLLKFDLGALPSNATILNAALDLYQYAGGSGIVEARRATAPWTEGTGERSWTRVPVAVRETAGVRRTLEAVEVSLAFPPYSITDPARDLRLFSGASEVPSQVYRYAYNGGQVSGAEVHFGATLGLWQTRLFNVTYSTNGTSVPAYRTKTMAPGPLWTFGPVGTGASGVSIVDLDADGQPDLVFGTADGYVHALTGGGAVKWSTRLSTTRSVPFTPQARDMDGDGRVDIVVVTNDPALVRLNSTGGVVWSTSLAGKTPLSTPTLLDVDGDGSLDVLIGEDAPRLEAYSGVDGSFLNSYTGGVGQFTPSILDVNGDGRGEFYFAGDDKKIHAYTAAGVQLWSRGPGGTASFTNSVAIGDVNGDGFPDIVSGDDGDPGWEFALNATDGATVWSTALASLREGHQTLVDLAGDGTLETLVGVASGPLYALNGRNGSILWTYAAGTSQANAPAVVDLDKDGRVEFVYVDQGPLVRVLNETGALVYAWNASPNDPGLVFARQKTMVTPAVADIDGDGGMEVVVPTGLGVQAFQTGGLSRDWRTFGYNWNHTHHAYDGSSPDGVAFPVVTVGAPEVHPGAGASWECRNGLVRWMSAGGDFGAPETSATGGLGWESWNVTGMVVDWFSGMFPNVGLFLTEADEAAGGFHAFFSSDAADPARRPRLTITYTVPVVDPVPRILDRIPDVTTVEDSPATVRDLGALAVDEDTPLTDLRWNVSGYDPSVVQITGLNVPGNHRLTFYPQKDAWASMRVTYWLTDPQRHSAWRDAWINITPVNDAPTFNPPPTFVVKYNATYVFDFGPYVRDVDDPLAVLTLTSDDPAHAAVSGLNVSFLYPESYKDRWAFVGLLVSDGRLSAGKVVVVKVTSDDPPVVTRTLPDITITEGELRRDVFDLDDYFRDPNNDSLFFSFGYSHLTIAVKANHSVDIRAESNWYGMELVTFRSEDPLGAIAEDSILVTVLPVDDPPVLGPVPDLRVRHDVAYSFNLEPYISDPDTPLDRINASTSSPFVTVSDHLLTLLYLAALNGTVQDLTIWVSDGTTTVSRTIRVTVGDDWPPVLRVKLPDSSFPEDTTRSNAYDLSAFFEDPDSAQLFYSSGNRNVVVRIAVTGSVDLTALPDWFGTERVTFRATDSLGALAEDTVWITVLPVNDAPSMLPTPTVRLNTTAAYLDLAPYLSDVDNNVSELVLSTSSPNATVVGQGLLLNYSGDAVEDVEVVVSDGSLSNRTVFTVIVVLPTSVPTERLPGYLAWLPLPIAIIAVTVFFVYRHRRIDWVFLVTNPGLLVSSVSRRNPAAIDTDMVTGMLTVIMNFAKKSFSDEKERELEEIVMGDRKVTIVRGDRGYLAAVYQGRTPGSLPRMMRSLLGALEMRYPTAFGDMVDSAKLQEIPLILKRLVDRAWWPFVPLPAKSPMLPPAN